MSIVVNKINEIFTLLKYLFLLSKTVKKIITGKILSKKLPSTRSSPKNLKFYLVLTFLKPIVFISKKY